MQTTCGGSWPWLPSGPLAAVLSCLWIQNAENKKHNFEILNQIKKKTLITCKSI
jgi:hypothetical protein